MRIGLLLAGALGLLVAGCGTPASSPSPTSALPDYNASPMPADAAGMGADAAAIAREISLGWNLGNTLEATGGETAWGNPRVTPGLIALVADSGFDAVRLPVAWDGNADPDTARIDPAWLSRVEEVVQYALDEDLYVILNIHWDGGWLENNVTPEAQADVTAKQRAYWQQIATHFRDYDQRLLFAGANEPAVETASQMRVLDAYHQAFVDAVRETGGRNAHRVLIVQGPTTDIEKTAALWTGLPDDPATDRLMVEIHYYTPWNFAGLTEDADWGDMFYYWGERFHDPDSPRRNADWGEEETVDEFFGLMESQFVDRGVPVLLGEYGAVRRSGLTGEALERHLASRAWYLEYVTRAALEHGMVPVYWDNGDTGENGFAVFDRERETVADRRALEALRNGAE